MLYVFPPYSKGNASQTTYSQCEVADIVQQLEEGNHWHETAVHGNEDKTESEYLGTRATHYNGELSGIAQALEGAREVNML